MVIFLCKILGLLCSIFLCFRFFIIRIQRLSFFIIRIFIDIFYFNFYFMVLSQVSLFSWLILSFFWFLSFSFALVIISWWLLLAMHFCILFLVCWSAWVLTSVIWMLCNLNVLAYDFKRFPMKYLWTYISFYFLLFKTIFPFSVDLEVFHISHHILFS